MSTPGGVVFDKNIGIFLYKGSIVGIIEYDHIGMDEDDEKKEEK